MIGFSGMVLFDQLIQEKMDTSCFNPKEEVIITYKSECLFLNQNEESFLLANIKGQNITEQQIQWETVIENLNKANQWKLKLSL